MNSPKEIAKEISKQLASNMIEHDMSGWPPDCLMFTYQPIRPASDDHIHDTDKSSEK